jgi:DNA repair exonuclease SbcCD nuclease subunit
MRVGIVGDIHLGINENKPQFVNYQNKCIKYIYEEFRKLGINTIIYLGDVFDKRQSISVKTLKQAMDVFDNNGFEQHFILGNHDVAFKNSNELNSVEILLGEKNKVYTSIPEEIELGGKKFLMTPWLNKTNVDENTKIIKKSKAEYLMGHLELGSFEMIRGINSQHGHLNLTTLESFEHVISGHFHCFSNRGNITYLGNVCQMNWNDFDEYKHVGYIDTETDDFELIEIPYILYEKIRIRSAEDCGNPLQYKDKIVKCYLYTDRNIKIERFITKVVDVAMNVNVVDNTVMLATENFEINEASMGVTDLWASYLKELEMSDKDKEIIDSIFNNAYLKVNLGDVD